MNELIEWINGWFGFNGSTISFFTILIASTIQISPIKWNPITAIFTSISKALMKETTKMIQGHVDEFTKELIVVKSDIANVDRNLSNQVRELKWDQVGTRISNLKKNILEFAANCSMDDKDPHSLEHYKNILDEMEEYERLITEYNIPNGVFENNQAFIQECYKCHLMHNSFALPGGIHYATGQKRCPKRVGD